MVPIQSEAESSAGSVSAKVMVGTGGAGTERWRGCLRTESESRGAGHVGGIVDGHFGEDEGCGNEDRKRSGDGERFER
jgi:hypothetical protein